MVERDGGHIVMKNMGFDDSMEELAANETEFPIDRSGRTASETPRFRFIMG